MLRHWEKLPENMRVPEVRPYYDILNKRRFSIFLKRFTDYALAILLLIVFLIPMAIIAVAIKLDSEGPVMYRQERVTTYGKRFMIHKFRTMVSNAEQTGSSVTVNADRRITNVGKWLRRLHLDEIPQMFDILEGNMSFVGTRPEVVKYVDRYPPEYCATLLLPAGITSEASIRYKNESQLIDQADDVDRTYMEEVLPDKMYWNLKSLARFRFLREALTMVRTVLAVLGKDY